MAHTINIRNASDTSWINLLEAINIYVKDINGNYTDNYLEEILEEISIDKTTNVISNTNPLPNNFDYRIGTIWTNTTSGSSYICVDNTQFNAVWLEITTSGGTADVQNIVGMMVTDNTEKGINVTYDSYNKKLDFDVNDPLITLTGDVDGSSVMYDLGDVTIDVTSNSYSKTESDDRYVSTSGDIIYGNLDINGYLTLNSTTSVNNISDDENLLPGSGYYLATQKSIRSYIKSISWQEPVISKSYNYPPFSPSACTSAGPSACPSGSYRYIINSPGSNEWTNHDNEITEWNGSEWLFLPLSKGQITFVNDENRLYISDGTDWINYLQDSNIDVIDINNNFISPYLDGVLDELYDDISSVTGSTGLEKITEGGNSGWRLIGKNPNHYGDIGNEAVDLSEGCNNSSGAVGDYSFAEGYKTHAGGDISHAEGCSTLALGKCSHAEGCDTTTLGKNSHAEGYNTTASGDSSHAEGLHSSAEGIGSHAEGCHTDASGNMSHSEGNNTTASGNISHAEGMDTIASGRNSHSEGGCTTASGCSSHAEGWDTTASGCSSHAEGCGTTASGCSSHAEGNNTTATGCSSHTEGGDTIASGYASHAEGYETEASGCYSHAEGKDTESSGCGSHAEGLGTITLNDGSHAEGRYNIGTSTETIHETGIGTNDTNRKNAFEIYLDGTLTAPELTTSLIISGGDKVLTTKEYVDGLSSTGLEKITEGGNSGWRLIGKDPNNYGDIGNEAVDLSEGFHSSSGALGLYSFAEGYGTYASGKNSHAEGSITDASGCNSHAEGKDTIASGNNSHAEGKDTIASGISSHAEGNNTESSGQNSHAEGCNTTASGSNSHAEGNSTIASGCYSHAEGNGTEASGCESSHAEGYNTKALNDYAHAEGHGTTASGLNTHAEGLNTTALGHNSHTEGWNTESSGQNAHAEGRGTTAYGTSSHAEGCNTTASEYNAHAEGCNTIASGKDSHAEGLNTTASGYNSHTEGWNTESSGQNAHAEGRNTTASGYCSHAEGSSTISSNDSSHTEGYGTEASGCYSHAEGNSTIASGCGSHAEGCGTTASGCYSHTEGVGTTASGCGSHAEGIYTININKASHVEGRYNVGTSTDTIHETGIGTDNSNRKNAFEIYNDGTLTAPELTTSLIISGGDNTLTTKEYVDDKVSTLPGYGESGGNISLSDIDLSQGNMWYKTITANTTFTFTNTHLLTGFTLYIEDGGSYTITWPSTIKWAGGIPPTLTATGTDVLTFSTFDSGTTWFGMYQTDFK